MRTFHGRLLSRDAPWSNCLCLCTQDQDQKFPFGLLWDLKTTVPTPAVSYVSVSQETDNWLMFLFTLRVTSYCSDIFALSKHYYYILPCFPFWEYSIKCCYSNMNYENHLFPSPWVYKIPAYCGEWMQHNSIADGQKQIHEHEGSM